MKSQFLDQFKRLKAEGADLMKLYGDLMLVEGYPVEETKTASGIIIQSSDKMANGFGQNMPAFYTVLYVGEGFYDDSVKPTPTGWFHPCAPCAGTGKVKVSDFADGVCGACDGTGQLEGYEYPKDAKTVPIDVQPGDIILTGKQSVVEISKFGPIFSTKEHRLCLSRECDIQLRFPGGAPSFEKVNALLASSVQYN